MHLNIVICTKDRPTELDRCLRSIGRQAISIDNVMIIDASDNETSDPVVARADLPNCTHVCHVKSLPGLPFQRNVAIGMLPANAEVVCFMDDDVELLPSYLERIEREFEADGREEIVGVCGSIVNEPRRTEWDCLLRRLFFITDNRSGRLLLSGDAGHIFSPLRVHKVAVLSGSNMCFRVSIFFKLGLRFDEKLKGYAFMEDRDFCIRASRGGILRQIPDARLIHHVSQNARLDQRRLYKMYVVHSYYLLRKNLNPRWYNYLAYSWRIVGKLAQAVFESAEDRTLSPLRGFGEGVLSITQLVEGIEPKA